MRHTLARQGDSLDRIETEWRKSVERHDSFYDRHFEEILSDGSKLTKMRDEINGHLERMGEHRIASNHEAGRILQIALELGFSGSNDDAPARMAHNVVRYLLRRSIYAA